MIQGEAMNLVESFLVCVFFVGCLGGLGFAVVTVVSLFMDFIDESKDRNERRRN
jgi:hypothetical protein